MTHELEKIQKEAIAVYIKNYLSIYKEIVKKPIKDMRIAG
jgi:hypothetical protein